MFKLENVKAFCATDSDTFTIARNLCKPETVRKASCTEVDENIVRVKGLVLGNFGYFHSVQLTLDRQLRNGISSFNCDCYELTHVKGLCRHCAALAMAVAEDSGVDVGVKLPARYRNAEIKPVAPVEKQPIDQEPVIEELPEEAEETPELQPMDLPEGCEPDPTAWDLPQAPVVDDLPLEEKELEETEEDPEPQEHQGMEINFGRLAECDDEIPVLWTPNDTTRVFHPNMGIIGTMGTGKTQFTKSLVTQLYRQQKSNYDGKPLGILIFDYKGDYNASKADFVRATNAKVLKPHRIPYNPMAIVPGRTFKPLLPVHTANTFKDTLSRVYPLGAKQQTTLYNCISRAYDAMGIVANDSSTWRKPAPTFDMVYDIYYKDESIPKGDSLEAVMNKLHVFEIFEDSPYRTESLFDLLNGVVVIDLSGYDPDIQSLIVGITLDQFYSQMHAAGSSPTDGKLRRLSKFILVDEADNFMREDFPALKKIMKEGREFGVGTILSTQFLKHFGTGEDDYSKYILTWVVHNVPDLKRAELEFVFNSRSVPGKTEELCDRIKSCERFHSMVKIGNMEPVYVRDKAFFELIRED